MCQVGEVVGERHRYYRPDLDLADMFGKVVFRGKGGLTVDRLFRELRAVRVIAPTVVLVDIGTNDLGNGCVPEDLAERIVAFARELLTIPSVSQVVVCEILTRIPVECGRFEVRPDFDSARQVVKNKICTLIAKFENINLWHHLKLSKGVNFARDGVHMSAVGMPRYVSSIRSAAVAAAKRC